MILIGGGNGGQWRRKLIQSRVDSFVGREYRVSKNTERLIAFKTFIETK